MPSAIDSLLEAQADTGVCTPAWAPSRRLTLAGGGVGHQHRDGQRADPPGALLLLDVPVAEQGVQAADAGGDGHAEPFPVDRVVLLAGRSRRPARPPCAAITASWAERSSRRASTRSSTSAGVDRDAARRSDREVVGPVCSILLDAGAAGEQALPGAGARHRRAGWWRRVR